MISVKKITLLSDDGTEFEVHSNGHIFSNGVFSPKNIPECTCTTTVNFVEHGAEILSTVSQLKDV